MEEMHRRRKEEESLCYLKLGTGLPWAGQARLRGKLFSRNILVKSVSDENFGELPEMGSDKQTKFRAKFLPKAGPGRALSRTTEADRGRTFGKHTGQLGGHRYLGGRPSYRLYRRKVGQPGDGQTRLGEIR